MPRPNPPPPTAPPTLSPFKLGDREKRDLAKTLGLGELSPLIVDGLAHAIACYNATAGGSRDTTVGNTLAELGELKKRGTAYDRAVARLADDRSGVDYVTHGMLQRLAATVLAGEPGARQKLREIADQRAAELHQHPRIQPEKESLRLFGYFIRQIFNAAAAPHFTSPPCDGWRHCRQFAVEVFTVAGIDTADFTAHPERLTEYLGTDF
jgi:hypothetical protein